MVYLNFEMCVTKNYISHIGNLLVYKSHIHVCSSYRIVFIPTSFASLPPEVMLHIRCNTAANLKIAAEIEKTYQKGVPSESELIEM